MGLYSGGLIISVLGGLIFRRAYLDLGGLIIRIFGLGMRIAVMSIAEIEDFFIIVLTKIYEVQ